MHFMLQMLCIFSLCWTVIALYLFLTRDNASVMHNARRSTYMEECVQWAINMLVQLAGALLSFRVASTMLNEEENLSHASTFLAPSMRLLINGVIVSDLFVYVLILASFSRGLITSII